MKNGGKRPGAGRKPGTFNQAKLERLAVINAFNQRVMKQANALFNAQLALAVGSVMVYRVEETGTGAKAKREHILVTNPDTIKEVLDDIGDGAGVVGEDYYFVTSVSPDNRALDSMLNRGLGKPAEEHKIERVTSAERVREEAMKVLMEHGWQEPDATAFLAERYPQQVSDAVN
jgi:hypothetical protein